MDSEVFPPQPSTAISRLGVMVQSVYFTILNLTQCLVTWISSRGYVRGVRIVSED